MATGSSSGTGQPLPALHAACQAGQVAEVQRLCEEEHQNPAEPAMPSGKTPLMFAVEAGQTAVVTYLLTQAAVKADINHKKSAFTYTALHYAADADLPEDGSPDKFAGIIDQLCEAGANVDVRTTLFHAAPLHLAAKKNAKDRVQVLLAHGADPWAYGSLYDDSRKQYEPSHYTTNPEVKAMLKKAEKEKDPSWAAQLWGFCSSFFSKKDTKDAKED